MFNRFFVNCSAVFYRYSSTTTDDYNIPNLTWNVYLTVEGRLENSLSRDVTTNTDIFTATQILYIEYNSTNAAITEKDKVVINGRTLYITGIEQQIDSRIGYIRIALSEINRAN